MLFEMHCHTAEHSRCSSAGAASLAQRIFEAGLQGMVITDHHYLWRRDEIAELRRKIEVPDHFLILAGQEVDTPELGDVLVYGAERSIARNTSIGEIARAFPRAALVWAHPYRGEKRPAEEKLQDRRLAGVEIFSSNHSVTESHRALRDWHRLKFTAIAGTDTHAASYAALFPTVFDHPVATIEEVAAEIRAGRCRPYFKEIPRAGATDTRVTELTIGPRTRHVLPERYVIKVQRNPLAWKTAARYSEIMEEIAGHGFREGRFRIPKSYGRDEESLAIIEEGIAGQSLFDSLKEASAGKAREYLQLAATWLARLHNYRIRITPPEEFFADEYTRLKKYVSAFQQVKHPHARRAQEIKDTVLRLEESMYRDRPEDLVQGHGDFHPKNIFIGENICPEENCTYIAAIDFNSSYTMPPAFDVGTFLAQYRNQFSREPQVHQKVSPEIFLQTYLQESLVAGEDFLSGVELFKARTSLSICYLLIKVGLGDSENLWRVLLEGEKSLDQLAVRESMGGK
jgi:predicted metal-dependent phosphoesterase TrpH